MKTNVHIYDYLCTCRHSYASPIVPFSIQLGFMYYAYNNIVYQQNHSLVIHE